MARTVNPEQFAARRREILDAAHRLVFTKGFDQMSISDIQKELGISSGAFHHYFGSREALLEAYIDRIKEESDKPLLPILHDPHLTAVQKLQGLFDALDQLRATMKVQILRLMRVWYTDANTLVRQKVDAALFEHRAPMYAEIVRQGVREGVFTVADPDRTGAVIVALIQGMSNQHASLILSLLPEAGPQTDAQVAGIIDAIIATHAAYMDAIERTLGAPPGALQRADRETVSAWVPDIRKG